MFSVTYAIYLKKRGPASPILVIAFISSCAESYIGSTLASYIFTIQAWHILHGLSWSVDDLQVKAALAGTTTFALLASRHPKRAPVTVGLMEHICSKLDPSNPLDTTVASCLSTTFYLIACTREFTVPTLIVFNPTQHVKPSNISVRRDHNDLEATVFYFPKTKCATEGKMYFGHTKMASQTLRPYLRTISKSTIHQPIATYLHTNTTKASIH